MPFLSLESSVIDPFMSSSHNNMLSDADSGNSSYMATPSDDYSTAVMAAAASTFPAGPSPVAATGNGFVGHLAAASSSSGDLLLYSDPAANAAASVLDEMMGGSGGARAGVAPALPGLAAP